MLPDAVRRLPGVQQLLTVASWAQFRYFDWRYHVRTAGDLPLSDLHPITGDAALSGHYHPTHPRAARWILDHLPIDDLSEYTFVDFGSGKGLMLLVAAEYPFARIHGVEFSVPLHRLAEENIRSYRNPRQRCFALESLNIDARDYVFPSTPLVVYLFNPFRHELLGKVIHNLDESLSRHPRDAVVVYLNPLDAYVFEGARNLRAYEPCILANCNVYRSVGART
jgi:hypothetical protein